MLHSTNLKFSEDELLEMLVATERYISYFKAGESNDPGFKKLIKVHKKFNEIWLSLPEYCECELFIEKPE